MMRHEGIALVTTHHHNNNNKESQALQPSSPTTMTGQSKNSYTNTLTTRTLAGEGEDPMKTLLQLTLVSASQQK